MYYLSVYLQRSLQYILTNTKDIKHKIDIEKYL